MILKKLVTAAMSPVQSFYRVWSQVDADHLFARYAALARRGGFRKLYVILSFDCDTEEDAETAWDVHARLADLGVNPTYAVPGAMLQLGDAVYRRIAETGSEFINHGGRSHTYFDEARGDHASCFFYNEQPRDVLVKDIELGHSILQDVLGVTPVGFRVPHFGTFQKPQQIRFLHAELKRLGYSFSTSTVPFYSFRLGPVFTDFGIAEFPVSGMATRPLRILDSWGCFRAPNRRFGAHDYASEGAAMAARFGELGVGLLNFYADPCHVAGSEIFFDTVRQWTQVATVTNYSTLLDELQA